MRRRTVLASVPVLATAGCIGVLTGEDALERSASPATVPDATLSETGYELKDQRTQTVERDVTVGGQTRHVVANNEITTYDRTVDLGPLGEAEFAVFATIATPAFEIAGRVMSPVEQWSNRELAATLQEQYSALSVGDEVDSRTVETLDAEMELSKFEGTATVAGSQGVDVYVHTGKVRHDRDFVIVAGIYPQRLSGEGEAVATLTGSLSH